MTPHKHAALIKLWADGATIEWRYGPSDEWAPTSYRPGWDPCHEYRVKPEPIVDKFAYVHPGSISLAPMSSQRVNLKLTFQGDKLIKAEALSVD